MPNPPSKSKRGKRSADREQQRKNRMECRRAVRRRESRELYYMQIQGVKWSAVKVPPHNSYGRTQESLQREHKWEGEFQQWKKKNIANRNMKEEAARKDIEQEKRENNIEIMHGDTRSMATVQEQRQSIFGLHAGSRLRIASLNCRGLV